MQLTMMGILIEATQNNELSNSSINIKLHGNGAYEIQISVSKLSVEDICNAFNISYAEGLLIYVTYASNKSIWDVHNRITTYKTNLNFTISSSTISKSDLLSILNEFANVFNNFGYSYSYEYNDKINSYLVYGNVQNDVSNILFLPVIKKYSSTIISDVLHNIKLNNSIITLSENQFRLSCNYYNLIQGVNEVRVGFDSLFNISEVYISQELSPLRIEISAIAQNLVLINKSKDLQKYSFSNQGFPENFENLGEAKQLKYYCTIDHEGTIDLPYVIFKAKFGNYPIISIYRFVEPQAYTNYPLQVEYYVSNIGYSTGYNITVDDQIPHGFTVCDNSTHVLIDHVDFTANILLEYKVYSIKTDNEGTYQFPDLVYFKYYDENNTEYQGIILYQSLEIRVYPPPPPAWLYYLPSVGFLFILIAYDIHRVREKKRLRRLKRLRRKQR